jgi:hypothetical protein
MLNPVKPVGGALGKVAPQPDESNDEALEGDTRDVKIDHLYDRRGIATSSCDGLSGFDQVLASDRITHSVVTPFDLSEYLQLIEDPEVPGQFITVQAI